MMDFSRAMRRIAWVITASLAAGQLASASPASGPQDSAVVLKLLGHHDLGGAGWNSDVWAMGDYAYVGTWSAYPTCLDGAVKVISLVDPTNPVQVATITAPANTQANDVKVTRLNNRFFKGDLLAISNEDCSDGGARGIEFYDVTDPTNPVRLSRFGPEVSVDDIETLTSIGWGVHNSFFFEKGDRTFLAITVDFAEYFQVLFGVSPDNMVGDVRILDVTDPRHPKQVGAWGATANLGIDPTHGQGNDPFSFAHDIWIENEIAYVSYWDAGLILLDLSDPTNPTLISQTLNPLSEEGNTHVAVPARNGSLVITGDEDFSSGPWGFMRIFDMTVADRPVQISTFTTDNTLIEPPTEVGDFSMHNIVVHGDRAFVSWYGDGIRVIDISDPANPKEIASFVPPPMVDPNGFLFTAANMWGVFVHNELVLASDMTGGLYILRQQEGDSPPRAAPTKRNNRRAKRKR